MEFPNMKIINESITRETYIIRRASFFDKYHTPVAAHIQADNLADKIFPDATKSLTFQEIREREADERDITASTALDFRGIVGRRHPKPPNKMLYSRDEWQVARSRSIFQGKNSLQAAKDASAVFDMDDRLLALEILGREQTLTVDPLSPLPTTQNLQTLDSSQGTGLYVDLSALQDFDLSPQEIQHLLLLGTSITDSELLHDYLNRAGTVASDAVRPALIQATHSSTEVDDKDTGEDPNQDITMRDTGQVLSSAAYGSEVPAAQLREEQILLDTIHMKNVVFGHALPNSRDEALQAQAIRRDCLLRKTDSEDHPITSQRLRDTMPFPPEFGPGNRKDMAKTKTEQGYCLCTCGDERNVADHDWHQCDVCDIWQHTECIPEGVSKDPEDGYRCQQCDPWGHRERLMAIRAAQPIAEVHFPLVWEGR